MAIQKLLMNVPTEVTLARYLDVVPGQYGPQLRLKGVIAGDQDAMLYLPGKVWANAKALKEAGVVAADTEIPDEVEKATNVPLLRNAFALIQQQVPGQKYADLKVLTNGAQGVVSTPVAAKNGAPAGKSVHPEEPYPETATLTGWDDIKRRYAETFKYVSETVAPVLVKMDIGYSADTLAAITATLFIERNKKNV